MRTRVKIYIIFLLLIIVLEFINLRGTNSNVEIVSADNYNVKTEVWNDIISDNVNGKVISLIVDGKEISQNNAKLFMTNQREIMISTDGLQNLIQCAFRFYNDKRAVIEKGETKAVVTVGNEYATVNDNPVHLSEKLRVKDGEVYIPVSFIENAFGYACSFDIENNTLTMINTLSNEKNIPSKYDYRTDGRLSSIKNQGRHSTCWAFASLAALESTLLPRKVVDYSEKNMTLNNGYVVSLMSGGDYTMAMSYLAAWLGPILESAEEGYGEYETPKDVPADVHVQEIQLISGKDHEAIKKAVFLYGGVEASLYMSIDAKNLNSYYYNKETNAYCYIGTDRPNHDVVIVGWDDNYSKTNFNFEPEGDGAYICQNSWGEEFGDGGIFYVSYYDSNIGMHNVVYTRVDESDNYDNIYQTDICGLVGQIGYKSEDAYFANVYEARGNEQLKAVSFYATDKNTEYEIYVVEDFEDSESFERKRFLQKGSFGNAGYYTVDLNNYVVLEEGHKYAVIVKIKTPNAIHPIAMEFAANYETSNVDITDGEGYISFLGKVWEHVEATQGCNICLKMFTNNVQ